MIKLNDYLGFVDLVKVIGVADSNPSALFINKMIPADVDNLLPYFRERLKDFLMTSFPDYDILVKFHIIELDGIKLQGVSIRNKDVPGMVEYYLMKITSYTTIQLIGLPTSVKLGGLGIIPEPNIGDMNKDIKRLDSTDPRQTIKRMLIQNRGLKFEGGLKPIINFNCTRDCNGSEFIYCDGTITISADSIFGLLKQVNDNDTLENLINNIRSTNVEHIMFEDVENYMVVNAAEYLRAWYGLVDNISNVEALEKSKKHIENIGVPNEIILIQTLENGCVTLFYNNSEKQYELDVLTELANKTLVIIAPDSLIDRSYFTVDNYEDETIQILASEGKLIAYKKTTDIYGSKGIYSEADISDIKNDAMSKENPADRTKIETTQKTAEATLTAMDGMSPDAQNAHFKNKVIPLIKSALALAYTVGYIMQPMAFGLVSFLALGILSKDGLDRAGDKMKAIDAALDEYLMKVKGKTDTKSVAFSGNLQSLKDSIANKLKGKKEDKSAENTTKEIITESANRPILARLIKQDLVMSCDYKETDFVEVFGESITSSISDWVNKTKEIDAQHIKDRVARYMAKLDAYKAVDRNGNPASSTLTNPGWEVFLSDMLATVAFITIAIAAGNAGTIPVLIFIGGVITIHYNGRYAIDLISDMIDDVSIYLGYAKADSVIAKERQVNMNKLSKEEIEILNAYRDKVSANPKEKAEAMKRIKEFKENIKRMSNDTKALVKESGSLDNLQLIPDVNDFHIYAIPKLYMNSASMVDKLETINLYNTMYGEASIQEMADQVWERIKGMPRAIYTKYREYVSRLNACVAKIQAAKEDEEREAILNKEFSPTLQRFINLLTSAGVAVVLYKLGIINPIVAVIGVIISRSLSAWAVREKRKRALAILRSEMEVAEEALQDAKNDNNRDAKFAIMRTKHKIKEMMDGISVNY